MQKLTVLRRAIRRYNEDGSKTLLTRAAKRAKNKLSPPTHPHYIALEITDACNLHCEKCYMEELKAKHGYPIRYMDFEFFKNLIDQCADLKATVCLNTGGESLMHPEFATKFVPYACNAKKRGVQKVMWFDNGMLFNRKVSEVVVESGVDQIMFSLDKLGHANDEWCSGSNYDVVSNNIRQLREVRGNKKHPLITINKIDMDDEATTWEFIKHWLQVVDEVYVTILQKPLYTLHKPEEYFGGTGVPYFKRPYCPLPFYGAEVLADGSVSGCCCDSTATNNLGNAKTHTLKEIFKSKKYQDFREVNIKQNKPAPDSLCARCNSWTLQFVPHVEYLKDGIECVYAESKMYRRRQHGA